MASTTKKARRTPGAKSVSQSEESEKLPVIFHFPPEMLKMMGSRVDGENDNVKATLEDVSNTLRSLTTSMHRHRMEGQSAITQHKKSSSDELASHKTEVNKVVQELEEAFSVLWPHLADLQKAMREQGTGHSKELGEIRAFADSLLPQIEAVSRLVEKRYQSALKRINSFKKESPVEVRIDNTEVDALKKELERMDKLLKDVGKYEYGSSLNIFASGTPVGFTGVINFGSGLAATLNKSGGIDVIATGGGGGSSPLTPTGTVNGSNNLFGVASQPSSVVSDGIAYYEGHGYSYSSLQITMDIPPSEYIRYYA